MSGAVTFGVLGPIAGADGDGRALALGGPRHRAIVARLLVARTEQVTLDRLIDDLWSPGEPPAGAAGAIRTFVGELRRVLEPGRPPRAAATLLTTEGRGYALRVADDAVDAWRFERAVARARARAAAAPADAVALLDDALALWRGPAYADLPDADWARAEARRLEELRLVAVERRADARIALGGAPESVAELEAHVAAHPWREEGWRLLAHALYLSGRQVDALALLRRAAALLDEQLGLEPSAELRALERRILVHDPALRPTAPAAPAAAPGRSAVDDLLRDTATAYADVVPDDPTARLQATVTLLRDLAVSGGGGLEKARVNRAAAVSAAAELEDARTAARVIGMYDVPAIWTRSDDPAQAAQVVAAARDVAARLEPGADDALRVRLLATVGLESRGDAADAAAGEAARAAERIARALGDPASLAFALNAVWMQSFGSAGLAPRRDAIGAEVVAFAARHDLPSFAILGHLIRLQALSAAGDIAAADTHASAAERLGDAHHRPLTAFFLSWYRALRASATGAANDEVEDAYAAALAHVPGAGMPGVTDGLPALTALCLHLRHGTALPAPDADAGPHAPWTAPVLLAAHGDDDAAREALRTQPTPPPDHLLELRHALTAIAAEAVGDAGTLARARTRLRPAAGELAGAGSGLLTLGPVDALPRLRR